MKKRSWKRLTDSERAEKALSLLRECRGTLVVEGAKDVAALARLGFKAVPWYSLPEDEQEVVILTDLDEEGNRLCNRLVEMLSGRASRIDAQTRGRVASLLDLRRFEEIYKKVKKKEVIEWQKHI